ncbi:MAG: PGF-CTERM sorting domain-containing protein [Candidatus Methanoperedens sp.]|nr:PGF-CTERM sorting domain-containing protein [Candidatus Methanoperedens sp.]
MNMKVVLLFLVTLIILAQAPSSFAKFQYFDSLNAVYGNGSCNTCHVNGNRDGPRTSYGTLFENQPDHAANPSAALRKIGAPPTATLTTIAELTPAATATPTVTTGTPAAPGFGIVVSLIGLFALAFLIKRNNR